MANPDTRPSGDTTLRSRAEVKAQQGAAAGVSLEPLSPEAAKLALHELRVHQIELEMQNEELLRAQTELDAARDRYFDLYDLAPVGYCTLSKEWLILEANLTAATLLGVPRSAMVKQPLSRFVHALDQDLNFMHRKRLLDTGDPLAWDLRLLKGDGTTFWGHLAATVVEDAEGKVVVRLVLSDVTERVWVARAQAYLAKAEWLTSGEGFFPALARFLADDLGMDYVCIDRLAGDCLAAETLAIWFDGHFEDNVSYTLKDTPCGDVVGKPICCFPSGVRHLFPKDQVLQDMTAESYVGVTLWGASGQPIGLIALIGRHPMADSDMAKTTLDLVAVRAAAELEHQEAETVLRSSERMLQDSQAVAHIGSYITELNATSFATNTWRASPEIYKIFGIDPTYPHTLEGWAGFIHPDSREELLAYHKQVVDERKRFDHQYKIIRINDGAERWVQGTGEIEYDKHSNPVRMIGTIQDITERKLVEEQNAQLQAQLHQVQKMENLGSLAGGIAHDMNNVLGAILGLASANIEVQPAGSPAKRAFEVIIKAAERGGKMVRSLLTFARRSPAETLQLDMNEVLQEEVRLLESTTLSKVRLVMDLGPDLRPITGDVNALTHALMNLCVNAVDAMPENGTLTLRSRNVDNHWIEVMVEDTGTGMPKEVLEKAMDPFYTTKEIGKGTGLGLSIVYRTVKAHQGQMEILSEPGQGTRVRMRFPACEISDSTTGSSTSDPTLSPHLAMKVLLVDDDELIQSSMQTILEVLGHSVTTARSGEEALAKLEAGFEPDLVILDMNMPGLGGIGTLPRLRALRPRVPVLLSTGRVDQTALELASAHAGVTLLSKPFSMRELQHHLEPLGRG